MALILCYQFNRYGINAVAQAGWRWAIVEDVAEVGIAAPAGDLGAPHAERVVLVFGDHLARRGFVETRPAATGMELGV